MFGLCPDLQGSVAGMAAGGEGLGDVNFIYLPDVSRPAKAADRPNTHQQLVSGKMILPSRDRRRFQTNY